MDFKALTKEQCEKVRQWRNESLEALRTPYLLTAEMQEEFYNNVVCNRNANARFWGIWVNDRFQGDIFIGMCGIENIEWENRRGEISIILNPKHQKQGYGSEAVKKLLEMGFNMLNLEYIWGMCYECNPAFMFWRKQAEWHKAYSQEHIHDMKYFKGKYYKGFYFCFSKEGYDGTNNT